MLGVLGFGGTFGPIAEGWANTVRRDFVIMGLKGRIISYEYGSALQNSMLLLTSRSLLKRAVFTNVDTFASTTNRLP